MKGVVAVCGKGGVGKTTISALLCRLILERDNIRGLAIDADPGGGLSQALSLPVKKSINDLRTEIIAAARERSGDRTSLAASIDFQLLESLTEHSNLAFLSVGRPEEEGCYCQVNSFLKEAVQILAGQFDITIIDAEAGVEQVNRRVMEQIDQLLLVSDLSAKGLRVAETIRDVAAGSMHGHEVGLVLNRVKDEQEAKRASESTSLPIWGWLPEDETVFDYDFNARSFLQFPDTRVLQAARTLFR